jgi:hypothetical protein
LYTIILRKAKYYKNNFATRLLGFITKLKTFRQALFMQYIRLKAFILSFLTLVIYSMKSADSDSWINNLQIPPRAYYVMHYCTKSLIYGEKTNLTLAAAATLASFVAYPLHIITGKTALTLQALLLAKYVISYRLFLNNSDSTSYLKGSEITELCRQYSFYLFGAGMVYATCITTANSASRFIDLFRDKTTIVDLKTGQIISEKTKSFSRSLFNSLLGFF